jgi:hypothetical protein
VQARLHHLALVLAGGPAAESGRALVNAPAEALLRASGHMRTYALKREALQRGQVTAEEASAHADALRLLAGQPALVLPWGTRRLATGNGRDNDGRPRKRLA